MRSGPLLVRLFFMNSDCGLWHEERDGGWVLAGQVAPQFRLVDEYLAYLTDRNHSAKTVRAYGYDLLAFCRWLLTAGHPLGHQRYERPAQFLFTHHGRRFGQQTVRAEIDGLFDATVRTEYERALDLAKQQARTPLSGRTSLPLRDITGGKDWKDTPLLKSRMAGRFRLRAPAQCACAYANICEHCPSFHAEPSSLPILAAPRALMQTHLPATPNNEAGSPKPTDTNSSAVLPN